MTRLRMTEKCPVAAGAGEPFRTRLGGPQAATFVETSSCMDACGAMDLAERGS
jgi:hypothetical protein